MVHGKQDMCPRSSQVRSRSFRALQQSLKITDFILKPRKRMDKELEFDISCKCEKKVLEAKVEAGRKNTGGSKKRVVPWTE